MYRTGTTEIGRGKYNRLTEQPEQNLTPFLLKALTSNEAPLDTQSQRPDKPSRCVKKTQTNPGTVTVLASTTPLHHRFRILDVPQTDSWLEKPSSARLQTNFEV